ncbi:MAG TPA: COX15/CtaA family protein [Vicinamibacterales bacterium]
MVARLARFSWGVVLYNLAVILWGAYVRATGSGAGCGRHWPLCNGEVIPRSPTAEMLIEFSHRLTSGLALLLVVVLLVRVWRAFGAGHPARKGAVWSMAFMLAEAAVGAGLVLFELVADNASMARAMFMAVHLANTFLLIASLALTAYWVSGGAEVSLRGRGGIGAAVGVMAIGLIVVGISGAVAALGDTLYPARSLAEALQQDLSPTSHLLLRLRVLHPTLAVAVGLLVIVLAPRLPVKPDTPAGRSPGAIAAGLAALQIVLGFLNVLLLAPVWMQLVHLLVADLLWIAVVLLGAAALARQEAGDRAVVAGAAVTVR